MKPQARHLSMLACAAMLLPACQPQGKAVTPAERTAIVAAVEAEWAASAASAPKRSSKIFYSLGIEGYNYTETGIIDYSVNGTGAFNLTTSDEDSGGGKTVCCFGWAIAMKLPMPIRIEWTRDEKSWCRKDVFLTERGPLEPTTFEVHFFPDRHIEVAITDKYSPPRLKLPSAGRDYRVAKDVRQEKVDAQALDAKYAECREGRFPIGELAEKEDRERRAKK
jgi:Protein of unknown function (DUF3304)